MSERGRQRRDRSHDLFDAMFRRVSVIFPLARDEQRVQAVTERDSQNKAMKRHEM